MIGTPGAGRWPVRPPTDSRSHRTRSSIYSRNEWTKRGWWWMRRGRRRGVWFVAQRMVCREEEWMNRWLRSP